MREVFQDLEPVARECGAELVDVERVKEHGSMFLRVTIDTPEGADLNACEKVHKRIAPLLEDVEYDFLEVASPGLDRPLKHPRDFEKARGKRVEVRLFRTEDGAKTFFGTLEGLDEVGTVAVDLGEGLGVKHWPRKELALIKLSVDEEQWEGLE